MRILFSGNRLTELNKGPQSQLKLILDSSLWVAVVILLVGAIRFLVRIAWLEVENQAGHEEDENATNARATLLDHYTAQLANHYIYLLATVGIVAALLTKVGKSAQSLAWFVVAEGIFTGAASWILLKCFF